MHGQVAAATCGLRMRPYRIVTDYILTQFHIYVYIYLITASFFSNLHLNNKYGQRSIQHKAGILWNKLSSELKESSLV